MGKLTNEQYFGIYYLAAIDKRKDIIPFLGICNRTKYKYLKNERLINKVKSYLEKNNRRMDKHGKKIVDLVLRMDMTLEDYQKLSELEKRIFNRNVNKKLARIFKTTPEEIIKTKQEFSEYNCGKIR